MAKQSLQAHEIANSERQIQRYTLRYMLLWWPLLLLSLSLAIVFIYHQRVELDQTRLGNASRIALHNSAENIQFKLNWILDDVHFLVGLSADPESTPNILTPLYRSLLQNRITVYDQLRLLDNEGKEIIRVNGKNGQAHIVSGSQLQDKSGYYYFEQSLSLKAGEILMSHFDLNVEHGKVETPYKPIIRFSAPVYDHQGKRRGFVIVNYRGQNLFTRIFKQLPDYTETINQFWMINEKGYWLQGPDPSKDWAFMFAEKQNQTATKDYPGLWAAIQTNPEQGQLFVDAGLVTYVSLHARGFFKLKENMVYSNPDERWFLIDYIPEKLLAQRRKELLNDLLPAFLFIAFISSLLLWLLLRNMGGRWVVKQHEKLFIDIMERIPIGVFVLDARGKPCYMNQTAAAIVGDKVSDNFCIDDLPKLCHVYREGSNELYDSDSLPIVQALQGKTASAYDIEILQGDNRIPIQVTAAPIRDDRGHITHAVTAFSDISELKQQQAKIREEETLHRALLDSSIDAIISINEHAEIIRINPAVEKLFGYSEAELIGKNVKVLVPPPHHDEHDHYIQHYLETGQGKIIGVGREVDVRCKDGSLIPCDLAITEVRLPDKLLFKGILRDIRERKRIEQMQKEFIATVSHELRTPLTSISGSLKLLKHEFDAEKEPLAIELLEIADSNTERLILLVNDILDIEKLEAGAMKFDMKPQIISDLLTQAVTANQSYAELHSTQFQLNEKATNVEVIVDKVRFTQVLTNLLSNAAKFSPAGRPVEIISELSGNTIRVTVADQGPGIPTDFKRQLFTKFAQAEHADSQRKGGTGLGLCIAKAMIERMGGKIGCDSQLGQGSRFYVELPVYDESVSHAQLHHTISDSRILICEDDKDVSRLLKIILEKNGFQTDAATNWAQARKMLHSHDYAAMTLDLMLPDIHWSALFEELRHDTKTQHLPVIVVSAIAKEAKFDVNVSAINIFDWLSKPIDADRLARTVREALAEKETSATRRSILYLDDDPEQAQQVIPLLEQCGQVVVAHSVEEANRHFRDETFSLIIINMNMPDIPELIMQPDVEKGLPPTPVMVLSGKNNEQKILFEVQQISSKAQCSDESLIATIQKLITANT